MRRSGPESVNFRSKRESRKQAVGVGRNVGGEQALVVDQEVEVKLRENSKKWVHASKTKQTSNK